MHQVGTEPCLSKHNRVDIAYNVWISPLIYDAERHAREMLDAGMRKFQKTDQYRFLEEHTVIQPTIRYHKILENRNRFGDIEYRLYASFYIPDREYVAYILQYK